MKYSEDESGLSTGSIDSADEAQFEYGSDLSVVAPGEPIFVYVSAPYNTGKNLFFAIQSTSSSGNVSAIMKILDKRAISN